MKPGSAAEWKRAAQSTAEAVAQLTLPSGFVVDVRRPPLATWLMSGRVPETFISEAIGAGGKGETAEASVARLEGAELMQMLVFVRDVVAAAVVRPRIVVGAAEDSDDEIDPSAIPEADFFHVFAWVMKGAPSVPINTVSGEVSVEALNSFRSNADLRSGSGDSRAV